MYGEAYPTTWCTDGKGSMKVVLKDNFARESVADILLDGCEHLTWDEANRRANEYNKNNPYDRYAVVVNDEYRLWKGMEDLV